MRKPNRFNRLEIQCRQSGPKHFCRGTAGRVLCLFSSQAWGTARRAPTGDDVIFYKKSPGL
jgi:hypothetical protein